MPCPHNEISIVQRSQQQSAIAAAAYQSGEKLFCEYDQQVKHYPEKRGIVHNEILLPANAPQKYACLLYTSGSDRQPAESDRLCGKARKAVYEAADRTERGRRQTPERSQAQGT